MPNNTDFDIFLNDPSDLKIDLWMIFGLPIADIQKILNIKSLGPWGQISKKKTLGTKTKFLCIFSIFID